MDFEVKEAGAGIKDIDTTQGVIVFYAAVFGNVDSHGDVFLPGAFTKTIQEQASRIRHLMFHKDDMPVGLIKSLEEDAIGLLTVSQIAPTTIGKDYLILAEMGIMVEHSVGFWTIKHYFSPDNKTRFLTEVRLKEVSSVTWGSNEKALTLSVKQLFEQQQLLEKALRTGNLHEETYLLLEQKSEQQALLIRDQLSAPLVSEEPALAATPAIVSEPDEVKAAAQQIDALAALYRGYQGDAPASRTN